MCDCLFVCVCLCVCVLAGLLPPCQPKEYRRKYMKSGSNHVEIVAENRGHPLPDSAKLGADGIGCSHRRADRNVDDHTASRETRPDQHSRQIHKHTYTHTHPHIHTFTHTHMHAHTLTTQRHPSSENACIYEYRNSI